MKVEGYSVYCLCFYSLEMFYGLCLQEGTVFTMHGPMSGTDDWRTGEIDGQVGLFPVSFVEEHRE